MEEKVEQMVQKAKGELERRLDLGIGRAREEFEQDRSLFV